MYRIFLKNYIVYNIKKNRNDQGYDENKSIIMKKFLEKITDNNFIQKNNNYYLLALEEVASNIDLFFVK